MNIETNSRDGTENNDKKKKDEETKEEFVVTVIFFDGMKIFLFNRIWKDGLENRSKNSISSMGDEENGDGWKEKQKKILARFKILKPKNWIKNNNKTLDISNMKTSKTETPSSSMELTEKESMNNVESSTADIKILNLETKSSSPSITCDIGERTNNNDSTSDETTLSNLNNTRIGETMDPLLMGTVSLCQNWCCFKFFYLNKRLQRSHWRSTCCLSCATSLGTFRKKFFFKKKKLFIYCYIFFYIC
jgi:hypothetical protein